MTALDDFTAATDETLVNVIGLTRTDSDVQKEAQIALAVATDETMGEAGAALFAVGTVAHDREGVTISLHAFRDGERVTPHVIDLGDELVVVLRSSD